MTLFELRNGEKLFGSEKASMASGIDPRFRNSGAQHVELEREGETTRDGNKVDVGCSCRNPTVDLQKTIK